jgi:hypothetical protein
MDGKLGCTFFEFAARNARDSALLNAVAHQINETCTQEVRE